MRKFLSLFLILSFSFLSACESAEERADKHFETGVALAEDGDVTRAMIEMRNVLQLVPEHAEARRLLADMLREQGDFRTAVAHYIDLTERYPDDGAAHLAVAEIALSLGDWARVERHGARAGDLLPAETPGVQLVQANLDYRDSLQNEDEASRAAAVAAARVLLENDPARLDTRRIIIDDLLRQQDWPEALEMVDAGLEFDPESRELHELRLGILNRLGRTADITAQLEQMTERFPDDRQIAQTLVRWYALQEQTDEAEAFLRARAEAAPEELERWTDLLGFLSQVQDEDATLQELDRLIAAGGENVASFRAMRAALDFEAGRAEAAIAALETLLADLEGTENPITNDVRADLARMFVRTGNNVRARELVDTILQSDPSHIAALKMLSSWQIEDDRVDEAVVTLRAALRESPRDPQLLTLMAAAHERSGEVELQREMLALAVDASGRAVDESLRYASFLAAEERYRPAEDVLVEALRLAPNDISLLTGLGNLHVATEDWGRAEQVRDTLETLGEQGKARAAALQAQILSSQQRPEELMSHLEALSQGEGGLGAEIALIRTMVANDDLEGARARLDALMAENADNEVLMFLDAAMKASAGDVAGAEAGFEALLERQPTAQRVWLALYRLKLLQREPEAAAAVLDRALEQLPEDPELLVTRAGTLERSGDIDGAIAIYEDLYARNSNVELVANNLASLLSTHRTDDETLQRAYQIARRLQASRIPAFRETYGWIATRLGRYEEALPHLEVAAEAYPELALAQYHYAVALAGAGRDTEALEVFRKVQTLDQATLPEADRAATAAEIERLEAAAAAPGAD